MNENKKINSSLVFKLNTFNFLQVLSGYILINIIIAMLFTGMLFYSAEFYFSNSASSFDESKIVAEAEHSGAKLPSFIGFAFPDNTRNALRGFSNDYIGSSFFRKAESIKYNLWLPYDNSYIKFSYNFGFALALFLKAAFILLLIELLNLIINLVKGARKIKIALLPITELTQTAQNINFAKAINPNVHLRDIAGTIDKINVTHLDTRITVSPEQRELKDLTDAINKMLDRINEAYRSQARFVSDASHELRTPIAVIQGYANLLDRWGKNDEKALLESIEAIKSEAASMKDLVEQLLFLARGDNNTIKLNLEDIKLNELISEIFSESAMIDKSHEFILKNNEEIVIRGDYQLIKQAIRILIDNSIKYTPCGGTITISSTVDEDNLRVSITDNGIGIPENDLPYVLDRFYRSDDSRARKTGGTGLGLSIAKWIVDSHGGNIEILSRKDIGTKITILFKIKN